MRKLHCINDAVKQWVCVRDGYNNRSFQKFKAAYQHYKRVAVLSDSEVDVDEDEPVNEENDPTDGDNDVAPIADQTVSSPPKLPISRDFQAVIDRISAVSGPSTLEKERFKPPTITIKEWVLEWMPPWTTTPKVIRMPKDIKERVDAEQTHVDLSELVKYLKREDYNQNTIDDHIRGATRLLNCVNVPDGTSICELLLAMHRQNIIMDLYELPFFNLRFQWSKQFAWTLSALIKCAQRQCIRMEPPATEANRLLTIFEEDTVEKISVRVSKQGSVQRRGRKRLDAKRIQLMPFVDILKAAIFAAMCDLKYLLTSNAFTGWSPEHYLAATGAIIVGIIYFNGFGGRSKEWQLMKKLDLQEQLNSHDNYIICPEHKTATTYGDLAKWIASGTRAAMLLYVTCVFHTSEFFLSAARDPTQMTSVAKLLKRFCVIYLPNYPVMNVNLIRKHFHTALLRRRNREDMWKLLSKVDAHSVPMAQQVYTCTTEEDDVQLAEILYRSVWGEPVEWPTDNIHSIGSMSDRLAIHRDVTVALNNIEEDEWRALDNDDNELVPLDDDESLSESVHQKLLLDESWPCQLPLEDELNKLALVPLGDSSCDGEYPPLPEDPDYIEPLAGPLPPSPGNTPTNPDLSPISRDTNNKNIGNMFQAKKQATRLYDNDDIKPWALEEASRHGYIEDVPDAKTLKAIFQIGVVMGKLDCRHKEEGLRQLFRRIMIKGDFNPVVVEAKILSEVQRNRNRGDLC